MNSKEKNKFYVKYIYINLIIPIIVIEFIDVYNDWLLDNNSRLKTKLKPQWTKNSH